MHLYVSNYEKLTSPSIFADITYPKRIRLQFIFICRIFNYLHAHYAERKQTACNYERMEIQAIIHT